MRSSHRPSVRICSALADLAEEVARFYGYANIPTTLPSGEATTGKLPFELRDATQQHRDSRRVLRFLSGYDVFL